MAGKPWSDQELKECIKAYFLMLKYEKDKTPYTKSEINKELRKNILKNRTKSAVEYRMQNISAALEELSILYITGYKPARNIGTHSKERIFRIMRELKFIK